jgi:alkylhydroperoxidase family enzyme
VDKVLADWRTAPVRAEVKGALGFLEKLIQDTDGIGPDDVKAAYATGVTRDMLVRAVQVCAAFSTIVRVADTFDFEISTDEEFDAGARALLERGYGL